MAKKPNYPEFEYQGKRILAVPEIALNACLGCVFADKDGYTKEEHYDHDGCIPTRVINAAEPDDDAKDNACSRNRTIYVAFNKLGAYHKRRVIYLMGDES